MPSASGTRDRILDEALPLFARKGFKGTTVTDLEEAAGLTRGAGGVFHHFGSKREILAAALERRFLQLEALNQIRSVIPPLGDRRAELRLFARYLLDQVRDEADLLSLVLTEARNDHELFGAAVQQLFVDRARTFALWLAGLGPEETPTPTDLVRARIAIGGLVFAPAVDLLVGLPSPEVEDLLIEEWVTATLAMGGETSAG